MMAEIKVFFWLLLERGPGGGMGGKPRAEGPRAVYGSGCVLCVAQSEGTIVRIKHDHYLLENTLILFKKKAIYIDIQCPIMMIELYNIYRDHV